MLSVVNVTKNTFGETARMLGAWFRKHTHGNHLNSAIAEHTSSTSHHYTLDDKILVSEEKWFRERSEKPSTFTRDPLPSTETEATKSAPFFSNSCHVTTRSCDKPLPL